jgi:hypothetical protein
MAKRFIAGLLVVLVAIQWIPVDKTRPPVREELVLADPAVAQLARLACYDCHSNENTWPWYGDVAPVSWIVAGNIESARGRLNFTDMAATLAVIDQRTGAPRTRADIEQSLTTVFERDLMPPPYYLMTHPAANLTADERAALLAGIGEALSR